MESKPVFFDPRGKRGVRISMTAAVLSTLAAIAGTLFVLILCFTSPPLTGPAEKARRANGLLAAFKDMSPQQAFLLSTNARKRLLDDIARTRVRPKQPPATVDRIVAGFYAPWEESGLHSLNAYKGHLTHLLPDWLSLGADGKSIDFSEYDLEENPKNKAVIDVARGASLRILPVISNSKNDSWDQESVHSLLHSPKAQRLIAAKLRDWVLSQSFQGINVDFENLNPDYDDDDLIPGFINLLTSYFAPKGLRVTVDIEPTDISDISTRIADAADWLVVMVHDQHSEEDGAGPIAAIDWSEQVVDSAIKRIPTDKLVLGIGNFAYDWNSKGGNADSLSYQEALDTAKGYIDLPPNQAIHFDPDSLNSYFSYQDDNDVKHTVWMLDAASAYNQFLSARDNDLRGVSVWALGEEDPGVWKFIGPSGFTRQLSVSSFSTVDFPYDISNVGKGEILQVKDYPTEGKRTLKVDPNSGLIVNEVYDAYAFPYVLQHTGYVKHDLCLTFDDGPDPTYTPQILDALRDLHVPAAFFVVGENAEEHSDLIQREYDEGHEIGNHTFTHVNLAEVGTFRANLEINATQRAIETILGRSTVLFRPPYNADSEPSSKEELVPVALAAKLHYVTVGEKVDPQDWNLFVPLPNGGYRPKTADDIVSDVVGEIHRDAESGDEGNIILFHDAGGNRDATVLALRRVVPILQKEGYRFVSVASLMGRTRAQVMPEISARERSTILLDRIVFETFFTLDWLLAVGFLTAIWLGFARVGLVTVLALANNFRQRHRAWVEDFSPDVSVVIAAFNEEAVIARTVQSVLGSNYPIREVIVVDDGSTDNTGSTVKTSFGDDPRIRLIQRENGGKSLALNDGIAACGSELVLSLDADTQLDPSALGLLVRHFGDPSIAAVAGNVKVGNQVNILTQWQAVEYTTSQNIDRRAYALVNGITVVPGAIGLWRKSAVIEAGMYVNDTLAEDMDLTWRLRRCGFRLENEPLALAYTEAPESFRGFFRQRFRWAYGTLQCLWKHRTAMFRYGFFGWLALPALWLFQILFQALAPLVDLQVLFSLFGFVSALIDNRLHPNAELSSLPAASTSMAQVGILYALFFLVELVSGIIAYRLDREKTTALWWLLLQRFAYRQIMYGVVYRSILRALGGNRQGWGKSDRKGTVTIPKAR